MNNNRFKKLLILYSKYVYLKIWQKIKGYPNLHLPSSKAKISKIPFYEYKVYIRPSASDLERISEFSENVYLSESYLYSATVKSNPTVLLDLGANIGLSTLSLLIKFPSITKVIGIEAEKENFGVLKQNYEYWASNFSEVEFIPIFGIASNKQNKFFDQNILSTEGKYTTSAVFRFTPNKKNTNNNNTVKTFCVNDFIKKNTADNENIICKLDIEGGEEYLLEDNTDWISNVSFLTVELHDRFDKSLITSSVNLLKLLSKYDFAVHPQKDILHCYSRKNISLP